MIRSKSVLAGVLALAAAGVACTTSSVDEAATAVKNAMASSATTSQLEVLRAAAKPLRGAEGYDPIVTRARHADVLLLGESTHGTDEFYRARADISRRLIEEQGFDALVLEADWPAAERVDRYVRGVGSDQSAEEALGSFERFPRWMWRNEAVVDLVEWLKKQNHARGADDQARVYGMDLYSAEASSQAVVGYLASRSKFLAEAARRDYACLLSEGGMSHYGSRARADESRRCDDEVARPIAELARLDAANAPGAFSALRNARVVQNAEAYYRAAVGGGPDSWNARDRHMVDALEAIESELGEQRERPRMIVWAHNSHLGDARATEMGARGELNVGQLVRERWNKRALNVGFTTYDGQVRAAPSWGAPDRVYDVNPGRDDSVEGLFHQIGLPAFVMMLDESEAVKMALPPRLERAIGVIYRPQTERASHYFEASLADQFDIVVHFDRTRAVEPLGPDFS